MSVYPNAHESFSVKAFTLYRREIVFAPGYTFDIVVKDLAGSGVYSARQLADGAVWGPLPDALITDCETLRRYQFLATSVSRPTQPPYALQIDIRGVPSCTCKAPHEFDRCIVGTWELDIRSMDALMETMLDGRVQRRPTEGSHIITITSDGRISGNHRITDTSAMNIPPAGPQELQHTRQGSYKAKVQNASKYSLMFCDVYAEFSSSTTMNGVPMELGPMTQFGQSPDPMFSDVEGYECNKFELKLQRALPNDVFREWRFTRVN